jgi:hypothetical protein
MQYEVISLSHCSNLALNRSERYEHL